MNAVVFILDSANFLKSLAPKCGIIRSYPKVFMWMRFLVRFANEVEMIYFITILLRGFYQIFFILSINFEGR